MRTASLNPFRIAASQVSRCAATALCLAISGCESADDPASLLTPSTSSRSALGANDGSALVLRGTVITPDAVLKHGYVAIVNGRIVSVSEKQPDIPGASMVNTEGIIAPGFVDVHNHISWNALPRWNPSTTFSNRDEWANSLEYQAAIAPIVPLMSSQYCDLNAWGELRALVGGTTSIIGTRPVACIYGLVRNLDHNSGFYGTTELNRERIYNNVLFPSPSDADGRAQLVAIATFLNLNPLAEALVVHAAEGTDAFSEEQFTFLQSNSLLGPKGVIVHGISLVPSDFQAMAETGTALVWSPKSNLELYARTTNVIAALDAGVEIAIAPDWAITGSSNMLDELKVATQWNREHLGGRLTDRQLLEMVTSVAARIVGIDDEVGAIRPGLRADLTIISGDISNALSAVINARPANVQLVLIGGIPVYGSRSLMERFWLSTALEEIGLPGGPKTLASPAAGFVVSGVAARLDAALRGAGASLAPLTEFP